MVILCEMLMFLQGESTAFRQEHYICLNEGVCGGGWNCHPLLQGTENLNFW